MTISIQYNIIKASKGEDKKVGDFMAKTYIQVRADEIDKEKASEILDELGTNLSAVVNMLLKQIIMTKSIPFEVKMTSGLNEKN